MHSTPKRERERERDEGFNRREGEGGEIWAKFSYLPFCSHFYAFLVEFFASFGFFFFF